MTSILYNPKQVYKQEEIRKLESDYKDVSELKFNSRASRFNNHQIGGQLSAYNLRIAQIKEVERKKQVEHNRSSLETF